MTGMDFYYVWTPRRDEPREQYLWEIFQCTDGILLSKGYVTPKLEENIAKYEGIHEFLRWKGPLIGDSGAWLYKYENEPPYSVRELLDYYIKLKLHVGAHLDHMILKTIRVDGVCKERGVDVIIFREGWRNGSRAHHNVRQFYLELKKIRNEYSG